MLRTLRALLLTVLALCATAAPPAAAQQPAPGIPSTAFSQLHWRTIGPEGNRFTSAAGIPGDPLTYYVGAASGGVWKTVDGGVNWKPIFDGQPVSSIGSLAVSRSDPNVVWAGTGEAHIRSHISVGQGIYKSVDAGKTWTLMGLEKTGRIARVVVHPTNPDVVMACALGHDGRRHHLDEGAFRRREYGLLRSADGSKEPPRALRRHVADRNSHLWSHQWRTGWWAVHLA
jgi:hypothetical protein